MLHLLAAEAAARDSGSDGYWHLAMIAGAIIILGLFSRFRRTGRDSPLRKVAQEYRDMDKTPDRYRPPADRAMADLLSTASSLTAEMNTKCRMLNRLVKDAEGQAARLERLLAEARGVSAAAASPAAPAAPAADAVRPPDGEPPSVRPADGTGRDMFERVAILSAEGKSVAEIAKIVNLSIIEVAFALNATSGSRTEKAPENAHG